MTAFIELTTVHRDNNDLTNREGDVKILIPVARIAGIAPPQNDIPWVSVEDLYHKDANGSYGVWHVRETYDEIQERLAALVRTM